MNNRLNTVSILHIVGSVLAVVTSVLIVATPWLVINQTDQTHGADKVAKYTMNGSYLPGSNISWQADEKYLPHNGFRFGWVIIVVLLLGVLFATYVKSTEKWSSLIMSCTGGFTFVLLLFSVLVRGQILGAGPSELEAMALKDGDYLDISYSMGLGFWAALVLTLAVTALATVRFLMSSGLIRRTPAPATAQGRASQQQPRQFRQVQQFPPAQRPRQYPPQQGGQWGAGSSPFGR